jgi:LacI family transcriptional regulator
MPSLRKLAQLAGISASTVSRALRDDPRLRPETIAKVKELAELYHYRPNRLVHTLVSGKSHSIGFILPRIESYFFTNVMKGVLEYAFTESYHVITLQSDSNLTHACKALQTLIELQVDGILLSTGSSAPVPYTSLFELWSHNTVVVGIQDVPTAAPIDQVMTDENQLAELMVDYLWDLGHRDVAYFGPLLDVITRSKAIRHALKRRNLSTEWFVDSFDTSDYSLVLQRWCADKVAPTAVIAYTDVDAARVLQAATHLGIRVPQDLSIMGCANLLPLVEYLTPPLTSVEHNATEIGRQACELLIRRLNDGDTPGQYAPETHMMKTTLVKRASCGPPRRKKRFL